MSSPLVKKTLAPSQQNELTLLGHLLFAYPGFFEFRIDVHTKDGIRIIEEPVWIRHSLAHCANSASVIVQVNRSLRSLAFSLIEDRGWLELTVNKTKIDHREFGLCTRSYDYDPDMYSFFVPGITAYL